MSVYYDPITLESEAQRERAHLLFLKALLEIEKHGFADQPVEGNPIRLLREQVWPMWHEVMHRPVHPARVKQDPGPPRTTRRNFIDFLADRERETRDLTELLDRWATACRFIELDDAGQLRPAQWMIEYARQICSSWSRTELAQDKPLSWATRSRETESAGTEGVSPAAAAMPITPSYLAIPMDHPIPLPGESSGQFKKRARRALTAYLYISEHAPALGAVPGIAAGSTRAARPRDRKLDGLDHYRWLVLFQCCGWPLNRISASASHQTPQAIWQGCAAKATLVGIKIRAKVLKKNS